MKYLLTLRMEVKKVQEKMEARRDLEKNIDIIQSPLARNKEQVIFVDEYLIYI